MSRAIEAWHRVFKSRDLKALDALLADDATFHSPIVHSPQVGKALTKMYLTGAFFVLGNESFRYVREVIGDRDAVLEFVAEVDGITINGVDMIRWNERDQIVDFKVMLRPLKAISLVHQKMAAALQAAKPAAPAKSRAAVFVVEDDGVTRDALVHLVNAFGWAGTGFSSAAACLEAVARQPPACIITDLNMPGMNGPAMIESLRADGVRLPIVAITAVGDDSQLVRRAKAAGVKAVLAKPVLNEDLKRILSELLSGEWTSWKIS